MISTTKRENNNKAAERRKKYPNPRRIPSNNCWHLGAFLHPRGLFSIPLHKCATVRAQPKLRRLIVAARIAAVAAAVLA